MIKDTWAKISYYWFIGMLVIVGFLCGDLKVKAVTITNWSTTQTRYWYDQAGTITNSGSWQTNPQTWSPSWPVARIQYRLTIPEAFKTDSTYSFKVGWYSNPDSLGVDTVYANFQGDDPTYANISCGNFTRDDNGYNTATCVVTPNTDIPSGSYFYVAIHFHESYVTTLKSYIKGYSSQLGTNAVIEQQTGKIIDAIDDIFDNNRQNTTQIINNQNQNTQQQIESQKVCEYYDKNQTYTNGYLNDGGGISNNSSFGISDYIKISERDEVTLLNTNNGAIAANACFYNINKTKISCINYGTLQNGANKLTIPTETSYIRYSFNMYTNQPTLKICKTGNQALSDDLKDDSIDDPDSMISDFEDMLPENSTITQLIGLPITLYTKILNSINGTCSQFSLGSLYGTNLIIPCIDVSTYLGSSLWNLVDLIISGGFVLIISKKMIKAFENFTSMKEGDVINND